MKRIVIPCCTALLLLGAGCKSTPTHPPDDGGVVDNCDPLIARAHLDCNDPDVTAAQALLRSMSTVEKVQQMSGPSWNPNNMFDQEDNARLSLPGHKYMDGPRGVRWYNSDHGTTVFPVSEARGASFDPELERLIGKTMAREMRYLGRHVLLAPTVNQVTHPRWGRAQESYGEDTFLLGTMGASLITGIQFDPNVVDPAEPDAELENSYRVQACVKHLAANNIEDTRVFVNAVLDERTLREVYLPHFKKAIEAQSSCLMTSYNRVNGSYSGFSKDMVRTILKEEWGFHGWTVSDWFARGNTNNSPVAGLDVEMPFSSGDHPGGFGSEYVYGPGLTVAVNNGAVAQTLIDEAVLRILYAKIHFGVTTHAVNFRPGGTKSDAAQELALRAAREGIVLLKNGPTAALTDDVLPLARATPAKVAVIGRFANTENMGDRGSSDAKVNDAALVVTPFEGLRDAIAGTGSTVKSYEMIYGHPSDDPTTTIDNRAEIGSADVLVIVGAYYPADLNRGSAGEEGEWKDRVSLSLPAVDLANITEAAALKAAHPNMKIIVVIKSGGAVVVNDWVGKVDAVIMAWYAGMKEGTALAEILFGDTNPGGKLTQSVPVKESDLPAFLNTTEGDVLYDYYHGYRYLEKKQIKPQYPFGYGLSYTTFEFSNLVVTTPTIAADGTLSVTVDVKNSGPRAGTEVAQLYVGFANTSVSDSIGRPLKQLEAFARVADLAPGATKTVTLTVNAADLAYWDVASQKMTVEKMTYQLFVGPSSDSSGPNMKTATFAIQ
jgi:beta-glucosidase